VRECVLGVVGVRVRTAVKAGVGLGAFAGGALAALVLLEDLTYVLYSLGAVVVCVVAVLVVLEPELRGEHV